jgi:ABC-type Fe3+-hydroxamate transport system substrate-binding protein
MRIVSLVPSITETLFDFELTPHEVIGRTKFCIHPKEMVSKVPIIGGTKNLQIEKIKSLKPDLIIANKEENVKEQVEELMNFCNVWVTEIDSLEDNKNFILDLGKILDKTELAERWNFKIQKAFTKANHIGTYSYLIWKTPYMTVGNDTFIHHILQQMGLRNQHVNQKRYPEVAIEDFTHSDFIFLSSEPYPFQQKQVDELHLYFPNKKIILVNGEAFSWYGTHLAKCKSYFKEFVEILDK